MIKGGFKNQQVRYRFWESYALEDLTDSEWEALCDGCGLCCLRKLQDEDSDEVFYTNVSCRLLDVDTCRCKNYADRFKYVSDCVDIRRDKLDYATLPVTCAYRLTAQGAPLASWHPLNVSAQSGLIASDQVHEVGISARGKVISEDHVREEELEDYIVDWVDF